MTDLAPPKKQKPFLQLDPETRARLIKMGAVQHDRPAAFAIPGFTDNVRFTEEMVAAGALVLETHLGLDSYHKAQDAAKLCYAAMARYEAQAKPRS